MTNITKSLKLTLIALIMIFIGFFMLGCDEIITPVGPFTITLNPNGATSTTVIQTLSTDIDGYLAEDEVTVLTKTDYIFKGWAYTADAILPNLISTDYAQFFENTTLYAIWSPLELDYITVTYNSEFEFDFDQYIEDEAFNSNQYTITAYYFDTNLTKTITTGFTISIENPVNNETPYLLKYTGLHTDNNDGAESKTIKFSYTENNKTVFGYAYIEVCEKVVESVEFVNATTVYTEGDNFDPTDLVILVHYNNGYIDSLSESDYTYDDYILSTNMNVVTFYFNDKYYNKSESEMLSIVVNPA